MPRLTASDRALILTKHHANRLSFAILLAFFRERGRFPRRPTEIERPLVNDIIAELRIVNPGDLRFTLLMRGGSAALVVSLRSKAAQLAEG